MIKHTELGDTPFKRSRQLKKLIDASAITLGGNKKLKILGTLTCSSGRRVKMENRVFFSSAGEAIELGYRPCGHCMRREYHQWKSAAIN